MSKYVNSNDKTNYAVKIDGVNPNYYQLPLGRQMDDLRLLRAFEGSTKSVHIDAKGKATLGAVKAWIKENKPTQFLARWQKDSTYWKNDSVEIFYK